MALADKDRIFTNLYGFHSPGLEGARRRGAWDGTKFFLDSFCFGSLFSSKENHQSRKHQH